MRKKILFVLLSLACVFPSIAQSFTDPIEIKKNIETTFHQYGNKLSPGQLVFITKENPEALLHMKWAKSNSDVAKFCTFAGGMLIGWPVGTLIAGGRPNWSIAGLGIGFIMVSLPFNSAYQKHAKNAVDIYNNGLGPFVDNGVSFKIGLNGDGLGIRMNF